MTHTYTLNELAELWNCSYYTIFDLVKNGELAAFKLGRAYRVTEEAVQAYIDTHQTVDDIKKKGEKTNAGQKSVCRIY